MLEWRRGRGVKGNDILIFILFYFISLSLSILSNF